MRTVEMGLLDAADVDIVCLEEILVILFSFVALLQRCTVGCGAGGDQ